MQISIRYFDTKLPPVSRLFPVECSRYAVQAEFPWRICSLCCVPVSLLAPVFPSNLPQPGPSQPCAPLTCCSVVVSRGIFPMSRITNNVNIMGPWRIHDNLNHLMYCCV